MPVGFPVGEVAYGEVSGAEVGVPVGLEDGSAVGVDVGAAGAPLVSDGTPVAGEVCVVPEGS